MKVWRRLVDIVNKRWKDNRVWLPILGCHFLIAIMPIISFMCCLFEFNVIQGKEIFPCASIFSLTIAIVYTAYDEYTSSKIFESKISFWIYEHSAERAIVLILVSLFFMSIKRNVVLDHDSLMSLISIEWAIIAISVGIFLIWRLVAFQGFDDHLSLEKNANSYKRIIKAPKLRNNIKFIFLDAVLLRINLFLVVTVTGLTYIFPDLPNLLIQSLAIFSFFFSTNTVIKMFLNIVKPLRCQKNELLERNRVSVDDYNNAIIDEAIIDIYEKCIYDIENDEALTNTQRKDIVEDLSRALNEWYMGTVVLTK